MTKFILTFHGGLGMPESEAEGAEVTAAWVLGTTNWARAWSTVATPSRSPNSWAAATIVQR